MFFPSMLTVNGPRQTNVMSLPRSGWAAGRVQFLPRERPGPALFPRAMSTTDNLPDSVWRIEAEEG